jgi:hypothetical protein
MLAIGRCRIFCLPGCCPGVLKIKIYRTIILPVVLYGCETWSLTLREERRLRVFENKVLRRVFWSKRDEVRGNGENYIMKSLGFCTPRPIFYGW